MKKIFIDTNIWLRYLVADDKDKFEACKELINLNEQGKIRIYTSTIVLLELIYTLMSFYKIAKKQGISDINTILSSRNITLIEKTNFRVSLKLFQKYNIKLADCLIASQISSKIILCTYDEDFKKIKGIISQTPKEIILFIKKQAQPELSGRRVGG